MSSSIAQAIATQTDPLAQTHVSGNARVTQLAYGPQTGDELVATATVVTGTGANASFSILLAHTTKGWVCAEFL